jgi:hypothetical protein
MVNISSECVCYLDLDKAVKSRASHAQVFCDSVTGLRFSMCFMFVTSL